MRLQPYVAAGEGVIEKYVFHHYEVRHRFYNLLLGKEFWGTLFGHIGDGWLDEMVSNYKFMLTSLWLQVIFFVLFFNKSNKTLAAYNDLAKASNGETV